MTSTVKRFSCLRGKIVLLSCAAKETGQEKQNETGNSEKAGQRRGLREQPRSGEHAAGKITFSGHSTKGMDHG
ncbi:hypothetical protein ACFL0Q_07165 [Thermodesulfobacteriota bacterium]